jgi:hypothetical protein
LDDLVAAAAEAASTSAVALSRQAWHTCGSHQRDQVVFYAAGRASHLQPQQHAEAPTTAAIRNNTALPSHHYALRKQRIYSYHLLQKKMQQANSKPSPPVEPLLRWPITLTNINNAAADAASQQQ